MDTSRQKAWSILTKNVTEKSLLHHCEAGEKAMRVYAEKFFFACKQFFNDSGARFVKVTR